MNGHAEAPQLEPTSRTIVAPSTLTATSPMTTMTTMSPKAPSLGQPRAPKNLSFQELIVRLREAFAGDVVDVDYLQELMSAYRSNPQDWKKYAKFDRYRYTRNLVDEGNGKFNLIVLCWGEGHGSAIHDHANSHCVMKILQGELCETRFEWPEQSANGPTDEAPPEELRELARSVHGLDDVTYINDSIGLHRVENLSTADTAVSLHLYSPPISICSVFNRQTGQRSKCQVTFWSKYGERRSRDIQESRAPEDN